MNTSTTSLISWISSYPIFPRSLIYYFLNWNTKFMKNYLSCAGIGKGKGRVSFPPSHSPPTPPPPFMSKEAWEFPFKWENPQKTSTLPDCRTCWGRRVYTCLVAVHFTFFPQSFQESFFREIKLRTVSQKIWAFYPLKYNIKPKQWRSNRFQIFKLLPLRCKTGLAIGRILLYHACQIDSVHEKLLPKLQNNLFLFFKTCSKF